MKDPEQEDQLLLKSKDTRIVPFSILYKYSSPLDLLYLSIGFLSIIAFALVPISLFVLSGDLIEIMADNQSNLSDLYDSARDLAYMCIILGLISILAGSLASFLFSLTGIRQGLHWKEAYFKSTLQRPAKWFDKHTSEQLGSTLNTDCDAIEHALGEKLMLLVFAVSLFLGAWTVSFIISIELGLMSLLQLPVHLGSFYIIQGSSAGVRREGEDTYKTAGAIAEENIEGIKTIAANNAQESRMRRYREELETVKTSMAVGGLVHGLGWGFYYAGLFSYTGIVFYVGAVLMESDYQGWNGNYIDAGAITTVVLATALSSFNLSNAWPCWKHIKAARLAAYRIDKRIQKQKKYDGMERPTQIMGYIEFQEVNFAYPCKPHNNVLQGVSFIVNPGDNLTIVGESGSGKSTILQLIEGLYYCTSGVVMIDGVDIRKFSLAALRCFISVVAQEPVLFNCSIKENIKIGNEYASDSEVIEAATKAEASSYINALPDKYETIIGADCSKLSVDQKQRIALARAIIRRPRILLLDEATSALDKPTQSKIHSNLDEIMEGVTTVTISQNLSSVKNAMQIIVLESGKIVDSGAYCDLSTADGAFKALLTAEKKQRIYNSASVESLLFSEVEESISVHSAEPEQSPAKIHVLSHVLRLLEAHRGWLALAMTSALFAGIAIPIYSYLLAYNTSILLGLEGDDTEQETMDTLLHLVIDAALAFVSIVVMCWALAKVTALTTYDLRCFSLNSLLYSDQQFYDQSKNSGFNITASLDADCEKFSNLGGPIFALQAMLITALIGGIVIGIVADSILALIAILFLPFFLFSAIKSELVAATGIVNHDIQGASRIASEVVGNIKTVQSFSGERYFYNAYSEAIRAENSRIWSSVYMNSLIFGMRYFVACCMYGTAVWLGAYRVKEGELSMEDMLITFYCIIFTFFGFLVASTLAPDVEGGVKGGERVFQIITYIPDINAESSDGLRDPIRGDIEFQSVSFGYKGSKRLVINLLSFSVDAGSSIGITGARGSGKSAIASLLMRFYDPSAGEIYLDSRLLSDFNLQHLRNSICWVGQESLLFQGSIFYNLKLGKPDLTEQEALEALVTTQSSDIIEQYGMESSIGWRGSLLSQGQKQRVVIARALVRKPRVLILDEAMSQLDDTTETALMQNIRRENFTLISITHRLQCIKNLDKILVIEK